MGILVFISVVQLFSADPAASLFLTLQAVVFVSSWFMLRCISFRGHEKPFWRLLWVLGSLTLIVTLLQIGAGRNSAGLFETHGFLPINPSFNGIWMASLAVAFLTRALHHRENAAWNWERILEGILAAGLVLLILFNPARTRSAPLALMAGLFYALSVRFTLKKTLLAFGLIGLLAFSVLPLHFLESHARISGKYSEPNYRTRIWQVALYSMLDRPLTGYGLGNFEMGYQRHAFPVGEDFVRFSRTTRFAHNEYLQVAAEMGLPAFVLFMGMMVILFRTRTSSYPELQKPAKAALIALCCDAFFNPTWHMPFLLFWTLLWSAQWVGGGEPPLQPVLRRPRWPSSWSLAGGILVFAGATSLLVYSANRYIWATRGEWKQILRWNPYDATAWNELGKQLPVGSAAVNAYQKAVELAPSQPYFHESLGYTLEHSPNPKDLELARQEYNRAYELAPTRANNALALGRIVYRQGDKSAALRWFETAIKLEPRYWEAYLWIARCLFESGETAKARHILKELPRERDKFIEHQKKVIEKLTYYQPSGYENTILAYDPATIQGELRRITSPTKGRPH